MASFGRPMDTKSNLAVTQASVERSATQFDIVRTENGSVPMLSSLQRPTIRAVKATPSIFSADGVNTIGNGIRSAVIAGTRRVQ